MLAAKRSAGVTWEVNLDLLILSKFLCVLITLLIALQWKCENLLGEKQPKFTETSTPLMDPLNAGASEGIHPGFQTLGRRHQKSKIGVSVAA